MPGSRGEGPGRGPTGVIRRWNHVMRSWARERLKRLIRPATRFEEILHEFARTIEIAGDAGVVEAALVRHARRMLPGVSRRIDHGFGFHSRSGTARRAW